MYFDKSMIVNIMIIALQGTARRRGARRKRGGGRGAARAALGLRRTWAAPRHYPLRVEG